MAHQMGWVSDKDRKRKSDEFGTSSFVTKRQRPESLIQPLIPSLLHVSSHHQHRPRAHNPSRANPGPMLLRAHGYPGHQRIAQANPRLVTSRWQQATDTILQFYHSSCIQNEELSNRKTFLHDALYRMLSIIFPGCSLYIVGSSITGFGGTSSDMDLCLMVGHSTEREYACSKLAEVQKEFRYLKFLRRMILIRAKVPILKFVDSVSGVQCDLNVNNSIGIRNSHLLNAYNKIEPRLCPLGMFVKRWAKAQNINDASMATISSYSLILMLIHYLQYACSPPVLPSLQNLYPDKFSLDIDVSCLSLDEELPPYQSTNKKSLGELFVGFLKYYAVDFNYEETAISVRLGTTLPRDSIDDKGEKKKPLWIEEPFERVNTARSVYDPNIFQRILRVFRRSLQEVQRLEDVNVILNNPM